MGSKISERQKANGKNKIGSHYNEPTQVMNFIDRVIITHAKSVSWRVGVIIMHARSFLFKIGVFGVICRF